MYVLAYRLYNDGGGPMPSDDLAFKRPTDPGWLVSKQVLNKRTERWIKRAGLLTADCTKNLYPPLYYGDCEFDNGAPHVRGEERDPLCGKLIAMAWYYEVIDGRRHGQDSRGALQFDTSIIRVFDVENIALASFDAETEGLC